MKAHAERIYAIYKPKGATSHDVVDAIRRITGERRVGHAGTLDPLASGVLVVGIGREATKALHQIVAKEKEYVAVVRLGEESSTDDSEGERERKIVTHIPSLQDITEAVKEFVGAIKQTPPQFSAIKVKGVRAYKLAREKKLVQLAERLVFIQRIEIAHYAWPRLKLRVTTGPGVYIRALARDVGKKLGVGGYLEELERTRGGEFTKERALTLEQFANFWNKRTNHGKS